MVRIVTPSIFVIAISAYGALLSSIQPREPDVVGITLAACLSYATVFWLFLMTATLNKRLFVVPGRTDREIVIELATQWIILVTLLVCTILFYTVLYRMGGVRDNSAAGSRLAHDWQTCLYFAIVTWTTLGYGDVVPVGAKLRLIASMEAITGSLTLAAFVSAVISQFTTISRRARAKAPSRWDKEPV